MHRFLESVKRYSAAGCFWDHSRARKWFDLQLSRTDLSHPQRAGLETALVLFFRKCTDLPRDVDTFQPDWAGYGAAMREAAPAPAHAPESASPSYSQPVRPFQPLARASAGGTVPTGTVLKPVPKRFRKRFRVITHGPRGPESACADILDRRLNAKHASAKRSCEPIRARRVESQERLDLREDYRTNPLLVVREDVRHTQPVAQKPRTLVKRKYLKRWGTV